MEVISQKYVPSADDLEKLENNFKYHAPKEGQSDRYELLRFRAKNLAELLLEQCPKSRELSLALTSLEDAIMWANAAIARNEK